MLAARLTTRPALRTLLRPKTTKAKDMVDPTTTSARWKEWAGQNHQAFSTSAPRSSSRCSRLRTGGRLSGPRCRRISPPRRTRPRRCARAAADDAAIADAQPVGETAALRSEIHGYWTRRRSLFAGRDVAGARLRPLYTKP